MKTLIWCLLALMPLSLWAQNTDGLKGDTAAAALLYAKLRSSFLSGDRNKELVLAIMPLALERKDKIIFQSDHDPFWDMVDDHYKKENLYLIINSLYNSTDEGFRELQAQSDKVDKILETEDVVKNLVKNILFRELFFEYMFDKQTKKDRVPILWQKVDDKLKELAPKYETDIYLFLKIVDARRNKRWNDLAAFQVTYYDKLFPTMKHNERYEMNNVLFSLFKLCTDRPTLERIAKWSKVTIGIEPGKEDPINMDTYANIMYKLGHMNEAIAAEQRSIQLFKERNDTGYLQEGEGTLAKMRQGLPTWNTK